MIEGEEQFDSERAEGGKILPHVCSDIDNTFQRLSMVARAGPEPSITVTSFERMKCCWLLHGNEMGCQGAAEMAGFLTATGSEEARLNG
jgi:hypothetical protein